ncbi:putative leader peptide [Sphaerisporangium sp. NPDC051011]|uniref:putative leader peptide n=1 Tax=Sphaerisporangium sp. NPDC051011 TaxID=3155792 RepID=UPI003406606D
MNRAAHLTSRRHVDLCRITGSLCHAETPTGRPTTTGEEDAGAVVHPLPRANGDRDRR